MVAQWGKSGLQPSCGLFVVRPQSGDFSLFSIDEDRRTHQRAWVASVKQNGSRRLLTLRHYVSTSTGK